MDVFRDRGGTVLMLSKDEVAEAIDLYLVARGLVVTGPRTVCDVKTTTVFLDPAASVRRLGLSEIRGIAEHETIIGYRVHA